MVTPEEIRTRVDAFTRVGCDEMIILPTNPDPTQIDLLAEALGR